MLDKVCPSQQKWTYVRRKAQRQDRGSNDCALFTIAYMTLYWELTVGSQSGGQSRNLESILREMEEVEFVTGDMTMRKHLLKCFAEGKMKPFPTTAK